MNMEKKKDEPDINRIRLVVFHMNSTCLGIDEAFVSQMCKTGQDIGVHVDVTPFHETIIFDYPDIRYEAPKILVIRDDSRTWGIMVDRPEDLILDVMIKDIRPMPDCISIQKSSAAIWGVLPQENRMILLVDPYRLNNASAAFTGIDKS